MKQEREPTVGTFEPIVNHCERYSSVNSGPVKNAKQKQVLSVKNIRSVKAIVVRRLTKHFDLPLDSRYMTPTKLQTMPTMPKMMMKMSWSLTLHSPTGDVFSEVFRSFMRVKMVSLLVMLPDAVTNRKCRHT